MVYLYLPLGLSKMPSDSPIHRKSFLTTALAKYIVITALDT